MKKAVFLDRDGVVNRTFLRNGKPVPPDSLEAFELLPGAEEAMRALRTAGWVLVIATNQPDVATGLQRREVVDAMHQRLRDAHLVDDIKVCFHVDADHCACRKPLPGMLLDAAHEHGIDLRASWMVGDRWRDIEAGQAAGCRTLFIDYHYPEKRPVADHIIASLAEAASLILAQDFATR